MYVCVCMWGVTIITCNSLEGIYIICYLFWKDHLSGHCVHLLTTHLALWVLVFEMWQAMWNIKQSERREWSKGAIPVGVYLPTRNALKKSSLSPHTIITSFSTHFGVFLISSRLTSTGNYCGHVYYCSDPGSVNEPWDGVQTFHTASLEKTRENKISLLLLWLCRINTIWKVCLSLLNRLFPPPPPSLLGPGTVYFVGLFLFFLQPLVLCVL